MKQQIGLALVLLAVAALATRVHLRRQQDAFSFRFAVSRHADMTESAVLVVEDDMVSGRKLSKVDRMEVERMADEVRLESAHLPKPEAECLFVEIRVGLAGQVKTASWRGFGPGQWAALDRMLRSPIGEDVRRTLARVAPVSLPQNARSIELRDVSADAVEPFLQLAYPRLRFSRSPSGALQAAGPPGDVDALIRFPLPNSEVCPVTPAPGG